MATFAIGDVQGCFSELQSLLELIEFDRRTDTLWFVGDLVNRGPQSLEVLRLVEALGDAARVVLGNHDLHLLATSQGVRKFKSRDTFSDVLEAPDCARLIGWLREQPLLHHDEELDFTMVHAGVAPQWSLDDAIRHAGEVSAIVRGSSWIEFFEHMYGDTPSRWDNKLDGWDRMRFITNALTRIRYCNPDGSLALAVKESPGSASDGLSPWFAVPNRATTGSRVVFGHWATLQLDAPLSPSHGVHHIDFGCVWGGQLAALRLDDLEILSVTARQS